VIDPKVLEFPTKLYASHFAPNTLFIKCNRVLNFFVLTEGEWIKEYFRSSIITTSGHWDIAIS